MKLAISDFDGTIYEREGGIVPEINLSAIKVWRQAGNVFAFCTGRNILSLLFEIKRYEIPYDYLICNNGATIFSPGGKLCFAKLLPEAIARELVESSTARQCREIMLSTTSYMQAVINNEATSRLLKYFQQEEYRGQDIIKRLDSPAEFAVNQAAQISFCFEEEASAKAFTQMINKEYPLSANLNLSYVDVCAQGVNKAFGIEQLLTLNPQWQSEDILTIGDAENDISMLEAYTGCSLDSATPIAKQHAKHLYSSVGAMLLDNL